MKTSKEYDIHKEEKKGCSNSEKIANRANKNKTNSRYQQLK